MRKVHIFYHCIDLDGFFSGALIKWAIEQKIFNIKVDKIILHNFNYNFIIDSEKIKENDVIFFLDCAPNNNELVYLYNKVNKKLFWIDHHYSIIEEHANIYKKIRGNINFNKSACENVVDFIKDKGVLNSTQKKILKNIDTLIKIIGAYDIHNLGVVNGNEEVWYEKIVSVNFSIETLSPTPDNDDFWEVFFEMAENKKNIDNFINEMRKDGLVILSYIIRRYSYICKSYGTTVFYKGKKFFILNQPAGGSWMFKNLYNKKTYDGFICYVRSSKHNTYSVSIYSNKDNSDFIQLFSDFNFKGHRGAGGFRCSEVIINTSEEKKTIDFFQ